MKKIITSLILSMCLIACTTVKNITDIKDNSKYIVEDKLITNSATGKLYVLRLSEVDKPTELHSIRLGKLTWKHYNIGDTLDENYHKTK